VAYDPVFNAGEIQGRGAEPASFEDVLKRADYLSLHMPLTGQTKDLLGAGQFASMKAGARLVCLARGGVVNEDALRAALDSGQLAGAALDVFASEPPQPGSLAEHPKVIASPHVGAQTKEAQTRAGVAIAEEVLTVLQGKEPRWRVLAND